MDSERNLGMEEASHVSCRILIANEGRTTNFKYTEMTE
jgi:hypothetical protein